MTAESQVWLCVANSHEVIGAGHRARLDQLLQPPCAVAVAVAVAQEARVPPAVGGWVSFSSADCLIEFLKASSTSALHGSIHWELTPENFLLTRLVSVSLSPSKKWQAWLGRATRVPVVHNHFKSPKF